jgi:hypothetical protein
MSQLKPIANCYRYIIIGLGKMPEILGRGYCTEPPCSPAYPGIAETGQWEKGYTQIKPKEPTPQDPQFTPRAISAVDFASEELANYWLNSTADGKAFFDWYDQVILVRVHNG